MAEHESVFAAAVAAVRPLLLGGTIRDAERIVLAVLRAANAAGSAELAAANERAKKAVPRAAMSADLRAIVEHFLGAYAEDPDDTVVEAIGTRVMTVGNLRDIVAVLRDAAQNGRSATETSELQFEASAPATKPEGAQRGAQGLCESERNDETGTER
jgi:hypothetical protein